MTYVDRIILELVWFQEAEDTRFTKELHRKAIFAGSTLSL